MPKKESMAIVMLFFYFFAEITLLFPKNSVK